MKIQKRPQNLKKTSEHPCYSIGLVRLDLLGNDQRLLIRTKGCTGGRNPLISSNSYVGLNVNQDYYITIEYHRGDQRMKVYVNNELWINRPYWGANSVCGDTNREVKLLVADGTPADVEVSGFRYEDNPSDEFLGALTNLDVDDDVCDFEY